MTRGIVWFTQVDEAGREVAPTTRHARESERGIQFAHQ